MLCIFFLLVKTAIISIKLFLFSCRMFVLQVNSIWKQLARKVSEDVKQNPQLYSSIYLPNGFFVAGGRFNEMYCWDTHWIVEGNQN